MSFTYGHFQLDMSCEEFDQHIDQIVNKLTEANANSLGGTPTYDFDKFRENLPADLALLSTNIEGVGAKVVGASYTNTFEFTRMYMVAAENGIILFLDADPEAVSNLGLKYDYSTKSIINPKTGKVVLKDFQSK